MRRFALVLFVLATPAVARAQETLTLIVPTYTFFEAPSASALGRSVADKTISTAMTRVVLPMMTHEDGRYHARREGSVLGRMAYAASHSFTVSQLTGTAAAAGLSNIYYPPADRTVGGTFSRWGTQVMWNTVANEIKEFWPDIHSRLRRR